MAASTPAPPADALAAAHARLLRDHAYQFNFTPPPKPPEPPEWLKAIVRWIAEHMKWLGVIGPYLTWIFWAVLGLGVAAILALMIREFILYRRPGRAAKAGPRLGDEDWRPTAARAKVLLADADRLAAEGRFDEAAHLLLWRSIDDIEEKRPRLVATAHTSRDIAILGDLPEAARRALEVIVRHVERSLFGGRHLDAATFAECRKAYEAFAFPGQWSGSLGGGR